MTKLMMKQALWSVVAVLALLPTAANAQTAAGFRAGIRSAELDTGQGVTAIEELAYGAYLGFGLTDHMALQIEAVYGTRGAGGAGLGTDVLDDTATPVRIDMSYVEVPVLLRIGFPGRRFLPSFFAGPYVGLLVGCDVTPSGGSSTACDETGAAQRFMPRSTDIGALAGAGLDMAFGESTLFIDARFELGLLSIQAGADGFDATHSGSTISAGFAVPLGR